MNNPKVALVVGIMAISIFPILIKLGLTSSLIAAFYRLGIASAVLIPYALLRKKLSIPPRNLWLPIIMSGLVFGADIAVWNLSIEKSNVAQATLIGNLAPIWVGLISFFILKISLKKSFWWGSLLAFLGMMVFMGFQTIANFNLGLGFFYALLSGIFYANYILFSKKVLSHLKVLPFMCWSMLISSIFLFFVNLFAGEKFSGFSAAGWTSLWIQGLVCQLLAWLSISYATQYMEATKISLSLLSQIVFSTFLAVVFLQEEISFQKIVGGFMILVGIGITFYDRKRMQDGRFAKRPL